jgi:hypothetical protein
MNCRGKGVYGKTEYTIDGSNYTQPDHILKGVTYYVYMNHAKEIKVDSVAYAWDDDALGDYHPVLYQYRFLGQFDYTIAGTYENIINQNPVIGTDIDANAIKTRHIDVDAVGADQIADAAVNTNNIVENAITSALITAEAILQQHIGAGAVGTAQIGTEAITTAHLIDSIITSVKLATGAVTTTKISDNSISTPKLIAGSVTASIIAAEAVVASHIAASVVSSLLLKASVVYVGHTGTLGAEVEGDRVLYIDGDELAINEWTNGGWTAVNGIKLGGVLGGLLLNMIACGGLYHPENTPTSTEVLPSSDFRVFAFENNYQDQDGVDDWAAKINLAFSTNEKFGTYALFAASGNLGELSMYTWGGGGYGTQGEHQAMGQWMEATYSGTGTGTYSHGYFGITTLAVTDTIYVEILSSNGSSELRLKLYVKKGGVVVANYEDICAVPSGYFYCAFTYNSTTDKVYVVVNDDIYDMGVMGGSWTGGDWDAATTRPANDYVSNGITISLRIDELLFYWDQYLSPYILAQHYTHGITWDTSGRAKSDILILPNTGGRAFIDGDAKVTNDMEIDGNAAITGTLSGGYTVVDGSNLTAASTETVAHGLGEQPPIFIPVLYCVSTDAGYSAGDEIAIMPDENNNRICISVDDTNVIINVDGLPVVLNKTTHAATTVTTNKWRIRTRCRL